MTKEQRRLWYDMQRLYAAFMQDIFLNPEYDAQERSERLEGLQSAMKIAHQKLLNGEYKTPKED